MTDQPYRVDFHRPPKWPVEGCTINVTDPVRLDETVLPTVYDLCGRIAVCDDATAAGSLLGELHRILHDQPRVSAGRAEVVAEDLRNLAGEAAFDRATREMLHEAADLLEGLDQPLPS